MPSCGVGTPPGPDRGWIHQAPHACTAPPIPARAAASGGVLCSVRGSRATPRRRGSTTSRGAPGRSGRPPAAQCFLAPPLLDLGMMPAEQHAVRARRRIPRGACSADNRAGRQRNFSARSESFSTDSIHHRHRRQFSAGRTKIAEDGFPRRRNDRAGAGRSLRSGRTTRRHRVPPSARARSGAPCGDIITTRARDALLRLRAFAASIAASSGWPASPCGPPPYGRSSTVR